MGDAAYIVTHLVPAAGDYRAVVAAYANGGVMLSVTLILGMLIAEHLGRHRPLRTRLSTLPVLLKWPTYYAACMLIVLFGDLGGPRAFIYFQF